MDTERSHRQFCLPRKAHVQFSLAPEIFNKETLGSYTFSSLRSRTTCPRFLQSFALPDKAASFSNLEGNFVGNQQLDGSVGLFPSPLLPPPPPQPQPRPPQQHTTHNPQRQRHRHTDKTQEKRTICTSYTFHDVRLKKPLTFQNGFVFFATSLLKIYIYIYIFYRESSKTPQHSKWNCVGAKRPQHMHMHSLVACG